MAVTIKRIYEPAAKTDGFRILADRLWPRGISKENAHIDLWLKDSAALSELHTLVKSHRDVTLLYAAKDEQHNQALALQQFIAGR